MAALWRPGGASLGPAASLTAATAQPGTIAQVGTRLVSPPRHCLSLHSLLCLLMHPTTLLLLTLASSNQSDFAVKLCVEVLYLYKMMNKTCRIWCSCKNTRFVLKFFANDLSNGAAAAMLRRLHAP